MATATRKRSKSVTKSRADFTVRKGKVYGYFQVVLVKDDGSEQITMPAASHHAAGSYVKTFNSMSGPDECRAEMRPIVLPSLLKRPRLRALKGGVA